MDGDFGALGDVLEALLVASRCPGDLQTSESDAKSLSDANLSSKLAFGASQINDFHLFFNGFMNIHVFDLQIVL